MRQKKTSKHKYHNRAGRYSIEWPDRLWIRPLRALRKGLDGVDQDKGMRCLLLPLTIALTLKEDARLEVDHIESVPQEQNLAP